jgi:hypothetical protein
MARGIGALCRARTGAAAGRVDSAVEGTLVPAFALAAVRPAGGR